MSIQQTTVCDTCKKPIKPPVMFMGNWVNDTVKASGGLTTWHACSAACAAEHVQAVATALRSL